MTEIDYDELARPDLVQLSKALQHNVDVLNAEVANLRPKVARFTDEYMTDVVNEWLEAFDIELDDDAVQEFFDELGLKYGGRVKSDGVLRMVIEGAPHLDDIIDDGFVSDVFDAAKDAAERYWELNHPSVVRDVYIYQE